MIRSRFVVMACVCALLLAPTTSAEEKAKQAQTPTPEQVARMILLGSEAKQAFVSQYLERADQKTLRAVQRAVRKLAPAAGKMLAERAKQASALPPTSGKVRVVTLVTRILETKGPNFLRDVGVDFRGLPQKEVAPKNVTFLDDTQLEVILRAVEKSKRVQQITAPRITVYDGQQANVSVVNQVSYIKDYDVEVDGERFVADPVVGVVQDGVLVDVRPTISKDGRYITLEAGVTWADLKRPIAKRQVILRKGAAPVTIQLPELDIGGASATVSVPDGGTVLLSSSGKLGNAKDGTQRLLLITAHVSELDAGALNRDVEKELERARRKAEEGAKVKPGGGDAPGIKRRPLPPKKDDGK